MNKWFKEQLKHTELSVLKQMRPVLEKYDSEKLEFLDDELKAREGKSS
jgi:hypothetical protein